MHRLAASILAVTLISCDLLPGAKAKPPTGPVGDIARNVAELLAPGTEGKDARFESFLADIDFAKAFGSRAAEISDQIKQARADATRAKSSSAPAGGRLASVGAVFGESVTIEFAKTLADSLDELTKTSATHEYPPLPPSPHPVDGATSVTTSTISQTESVSSVGPQVKLTLNWSYRETTNDKTSGATLVDISEDRTMVGAINICPDGQGAVGAFVDVKDKFTGFANGVTTTLTATSGTVFTGYVGDNAMLQNVHETVQDKQSWESASGSGSYEATLSATSNADASGSTSGGLDGNSFQGAFTASDAAAVVRGAKAAAWSFVLNGHSLAEAYQSAQKLWRNGRCVMVQAPDYSAETPIAVADQQTPQYDQAVDPSSETKFSASLKHRFEGAAPSAPLTAMLTGGAKSVAPNRIDGGSGSLTYKAPDEDGKKATVKMQSTSKRGIGTLVLDFHTGGALTLTITGDLSGDASMLGSVRTRDTVKIGPLEFKKLVGDIWEATGPWTAMINSVTTAAGATDTCTGSESGMVTLMAGIETRGPNRVWVIDPGDATYDGGKGTTTCVNSVGDQILRGALVRATRTYELNGDSAELFMGNLGAFTIPADGGTVRVHGSIGGVSGSWTSDGTATGKNK
jgi:hypothetical protein